jgi:hypothetical protein
MEGEGLAQGNNSKGFYFWRLSLFLVRYVFASKFGKACVEC